MDDFYAARSRIIPPLPWPIFAPPLSIDDAVDFQLAIGPAGEVYREAGKLAERRRKEIVDALKRELAPYLMPEGVIMGSSSWKISARNHG